MQSGRILVSESLAETLWRLEEVRQGFRPKSTAQVQEALQWVLSRQGLKGAYDGLFAATENDRRGVRLLTGERIESAALRHILGEEALRTAIVWNLKSSPAVKKATEGFNKLLDGGTETCAKESGFYCCYKCTPAFLRTLAVVKTDNWDKTLEKGVKRIREERLPEGRWHGFPFYYTLLTLSEIDTPPAKAELRHARKGQKDYSTDIKKRTEYHVSEDWRYRQPSQCSAIQYERISLHQPRIQISARAPQQTCIRSSCSWDSLRKS